MSFSFVSYIMKIMFYIRCYPNETTLVVNCAANAMNALTMPNAISFTDSYKNVGLLTFNCDLSIYNNTR